MMKSSRGFLFFLVIAACLASSMGAGGSAPTPGESQVSEASTSTAPPATVAVTDPYGCREPYAVPYDLASQDHVGADAFAWQTFLGLNLNPGESRDGEPTWASWTNTVDLINCNQPTAPAAGTCIDGRFFPKACTEIEGYADHAVIDQVGKVDDLVFGAESKGLSSHPVVAANGTFLRYQILISPPLSSWLIGQSLQAPATLQSMQSNMGQVVFLCSDPKVVGTNYQSMILKLAWMEAPQGATTSQPASDIFRREMLVYTPSWRSSGGEATCVKKTLGLVGVHIARKTVSQPGWVWATFEHRDNAPDCLALPPSGDAQGAGGPSKACPETVDRGWNFYAASCQGDRQAGPCQSCNSPPQANGEDYPCINGEDQSGYLEAKLAYGLQYQDWVDAGRKGSPPNPPSQPQSWCLDRPPAASGGLSRLCRQVAPGYYYPGVTSWDDTPPNKACQPAGSLWANYQLIGTQWTGGDLSASGSCPNVQAKIWQDVPSKKFPVVNHALIRPLLKGFDGDDRNRRPFLANTSMESYERSNCMGCHSKSTVAQRVEGKPANLPSSAYEPKSPGSDFVYFLGLEVPAFDARQRTSSTEGSAVDAPAQGSPQGESTGSASGDQPRTTGPGR